MDHTEAPVARSKAISNFVPDFTTTLVGDTTILENILARLIPKEGLAQFTVLVVILNDTILLSVDDVVTIKNNVLPSSKRLTG